MPNTEIISGLPLPPGPKGKFFFGNALRLAGHWSGYSAECAREYGGVVFYKFFHVPVVMVSNPDAIESVLVRNASNFHKSRDYAPIRSFLGNGLLTSEGAFWQSQRQLIQPAFRHENIAAYAQIMSDSAANLLKRWRDVETRDLQYEMSSLTLEIVAKALFGSKVAHDSKFIGTEIATVMDRFLLQAALSFLLPERIPLPKGPRLLRSRKRLNKVIQSIINDRRMHPIESNDLLQTLLAAQDEHGTRMSDDQLRDEIMTLFMAGHETTANALCWTWYLLAQNPEAQQKLHRELDNVLHGVPPTLADLPRLSYTELVVKESLRLYPPAWGIGRRAIEEFELSGYRIPAGTNVFLMQWLTHRDARFFPEPERFEPERWRDDPIRRGKLPRFAYFPFGGGPRVCIGAGFAMMETVLLLATIAQRYSFSLPPDANVEPFFSITLRPKDGLRMQLHQRG
ncbi:MAG TPA: cytochrome P450 [Candidatus Acidoferrum sp.]|nr:cytochrome P450 [Candidatus Acidoferrum sp.]